MLQDIHRFQSLVDSEVNGDVNCSKVAKDLCKIIFSDIVSDLYGREELNEILLVLQSIGRNIPAFNDLIISDDFLQMVEEAVIHLKKVCASQRNEEAFLLMEQFMDAINILSESSTEGKSALVVKFIEVYFDILLEAQSDFRHRLEVLRSLNILLEDVPSTVKEDLLNKDNFIGLLKKVADLLHDIGDYEFQVCISECLFRVIPKKIRKQVSSSIFQESRRGQRFFDIRDNEFETDCRLFLNEINTSLKQNKRFIIQSTVNTRL